MTRTLLMYVREKNNGRLGNLLDGLELDEAYLADANNWVSHAFLQVLYARMIALLEDHQAVYKMALVSERLQSLGILDRIVRLLGSPRFIFTAAPRYNKLLKQNGDVIVHELGDHYAILEDRYHDGRQKTRHDCDYTRAILAGIPTVFGMPLAGVEEIECQVAPEVYGERIRGFTPEEAMALDLGQTLSPASLELATAVLTEELEREADPDADPSRSRTIEVEHSCKDGS